MCKHGKYAYGNMKNIVKYGKIIKEGHIWPTFQKYCSSLLNYSSFPIHIFIFLITASPHCVLYCCNSLFWTKPPLKILFLATKLHSLHEICHVTEWVSLPFQPVFQACIFWRCFVFCIPYYMCLCDYLISLTWL